jgi:hypothetical protein
MKVLNCGSTNRPEQGSRRAFEHGRASKLGRAFEHGCAGVLRALRILFVELPDEGSAEGRALWCGDHEAGPRSRSPQRTAPKVDLSMIDSMIDFETMYRPMPTRPWAPAVQPRSDRHRPIISGVAPPGLTIRLRFRVALVGGPAKAPIDLGNSFQVAGGLCFRAQPKQPRYGLCLVVFVLNAICALAIFEHILHRRTLCSGNFLA